MIIASRPSTTDTRSNTPSGGVSIAPLVSDKNSDANSKAAARLISMTCTSGLPAGRIISYIP